MTNKSEARNLLAGETSPYLLQHADNPVHWRPWGDNALAEARELERPILLSVGYAACHWCHVMAHESFENPQIAALMNRLFVNIKVDREERPDVDQIYMTALHAMGEQGGWPLTMFLDPEGRPFWGGTYFPPSPRYGRPGFGDVLTAIAKAWRDDKSAIANNTSALQAHLSSLSAAPAGTGLPDDDALAKLSAALLSVHDPVNGGLAGPPKFPNAPMTEIWLRDARGDPASPPGRAFLLTLSRMSLGGIYDHLGGGLARYSVDGQWLAPHFEKMLYDNAHYIRSLVAASQLTATDPHTAKLYRWRIEETIGWLSREMRLPGGAFASSIDADSEGEEGRYYVWDFDEVQKILGDDADAFCSAYDVTPAGNFEGRNIPNLLSAKEPYDSLERFSSSRSALLAKRRTRIPPALDDKVLCDWNGYMIRALAEAASTFENENWLALAQISFRFIAESMDADGILAHSWRNYRLVRPAFASDYGAMMNAALSLYAATLNDDFVGRARRWFETLEAEYGDGAGGYYLTSARSTGLLHRPRCDQDEANPSAASQILEALARLSQITGDTALSDRAFRLAGNIHATTENRNQGIAGFHNAYDSLTRGRHVNLFAVDKALLDPFIAVLRTIPDPSLTFAVRSRETTANYMGMSLAPSGGAPCAIICTRRQCSAPFTSPSELQEALNSFIIAG